MVVTGTYRQVYIDEGDLDLVFDQQEGSVLRLFFYSIDPHGSSSSRIHVVCNQNGTGCTTEIYSLAYAGGDSRCSVEAAVNHLVGGGTSRLVSRFVLKDRAQGSYAGEVVLAQDAQQVDAQQSNRNLLLSDDAQMRIRPVLEIYADDVKASHGTSTGQLDEDAILYMQQRGISRQEAEQMLVEAFMAECITPLNNEAEQEHILQMIHTSHRITISRKQKAETGKQKTEKRKKDTAYKQQPIINPKNLITL